VFRWIGVWWQLHIHIADILISFVLGGIFYLVVEAPTAHAIKILWKKS
jgi:hypothetical protein